MRIRLGTVLAVTTISTVTNSARAQTQVSEIQVVDISNHGVKSVVVVVTREGATPLLETDENGVARTSYACALGVQLRAEPSDKSYYHSRPTFCAPSTKLTVTPKRFVVKLNVMADAAVQAKNYADAAIVYAHLAQVGRDLELAETEQWTLNTITSAGYAMLGSLSPKSTSPVVSSWDPSKPCKVSAQGACELSEGYQALLKIYGAEKGVSTANLLNYEVLSSLGGKDIHTYLSMANREEPAMLRRSPVQVVNQSETLSGVVEFVGGNRLVVRTPSGEIRHLELPESTRCIVDGKELTVRELKPGTKVTATIATTTNPVTERTTTVGSGTVWWVAGTNVILTLPNGENRQYKVKDDYKFMVNGQPATVFDLRKGMRVSAEKIVEEPRVEIASNTTVTGQAPAAAVAQTTPPPAAASAPAAAPGAAPAMLPATGSPFPAIGLVGLLCIGASLGLRVACRVRKPKRPPSG